MKWLIALLLAVAALPLAAQEAEVTSPYADTQLENPALEAQARELMHTLRCITCQSQSIADSEAPMAAEMRSLVRERIMAGETPQEVRGWLVERYGAYVTYEPELTSTTWPLFVGPVLILLAVAGLAWSRIRRRRAA
ncbi:cytochrome c-type biogenesis protein [Pseudoblastomonas halimionae]|uniref:Cytochrome c-type biogenesis protein n=1 Tax=Alteriqipengyuania halimionae TaxID=1926630 RepID=A0A6I4U080_9SPHN|nr:cytochrome c-type biogenesis protein [Alteriqipengyuania halimionae]MXP09176.1 cytochrome c-type biogenesis protein CcmH [Alteriqipengyuania halimionae]